jgi:hypothetical protein
VSSSQQTNVAYTILFAEEQLWYHYVAATKEKKGSVRMRDDPSQLITTSSLLQQSQDTTTTTGSEKISEDNALFCYDLKLLNALINIILGLKLHKLGALNIPLYHPRFAVPKKVFLALSISLSLCVSVLLPFLFLLIM